MIFLLLFLCSELIASSSSLSLEGWKILEENHQLVLAQNLNDQKSFVSITQRYDEDLKDLVSGMNQFKLNQLIEQRKRAMGFVSIKNWRASKSIWKNNEVKIEGSYVDHKGQQVEFIEYHRYTKNRSLQILFTSPKLKSINPDVVLKKYEVTLR